MKKQVKKITKKILILSLITSLVFTTCFSHKKIKVEAASVVGTLGAYTLYEICLYLGGLAATALGVGYAYENRDEIAEFGKSVIDSITDLPEEGWLLGSYTADSSYVYGSEALQEVQDTSWEVIQGGGQSPKNDDDNDDDGDKDSDDRTLELDMTGFFLTEIGLNYFNNTIKPIYDNWVNKEEDNILEGYYGAIDAVGFDGSFKKNTSGNYIGTFDMVFASVSNHYKLESTGVLFAYCYENDPYFSYVGYDTYGGRFVAGSALENQWFTSDIVDGENYFTTDLPILGSKEAVALARATGELTDIVNLKKSYRVADWIAEDEYWKGYLEGIANSLRSLGDLVNIAQQLANSAYNNKPDAIAYGSMMTDLGQEYAPMEYPIIDPVYWPATNPTPQLDPSVFPNYQPSTDPVPDPDPDPGQNPDSGDPDNPDNPGNQDPDDMEIDLDGLLSLFNILFYIIMIIIMLIYLFLACLAFIVMIFRVPASSSMLPEEMVLGFEHLKTIMIPGMNISIYSFAMALIYMFIVFAVIKLLRHEINDFKIPRSK